MDAVSWTDWVPSLAMGIGLAACAGLRAWLPLLLSGLLARARAPGPGPSLRFLASHAAPLGGAAAPRRAPGAGPFLPLHRLERGPDPLRRGHGRRDARRQDSRRRP